MLGRAIPASAAVVAAVALLAAGCVAPPPKVAQEAEPTSAGKNGRIAYASTTGSGLKLGSIYTIDPSGGGRSEVPRTAAAFGSAPSYSPDGGKIAYAGFAGLNVDLAESDIYTIDVGGGGRAQVTDTDDASEWDPSYSPDGEKIAYTAYKEEGPAGGDIYTIGAGGGGKFRVTDTDEDEFQPSWGSRP